MTERRENIARALFGAIHDAALWPTQAEDSKAHYRRLADAAIAADGLQARVLQLAEELTAWANTNEKLGRSPLIDRDAEFWHGGMCEAQRSAAARIRAAVDGADSGSATT